MYQPKGPGARVALELSAQAAHSLVNTILKVLRKQKWVTTWNQRPGNKPSQKLASGKVKRLLSNSSQINDVTEKIRNLNAKAQSRQDARKNRVFPTWRGLLVAKLTLASPRNWVSKLSLDTSHPRYVGNTGKILSWAKGQTNLRKIFAPLHPGVLALKINFFQGSDWWETSSTG